MDTYYDPEYDRTVDETVIRNQYEWFMTNMSMTKTYEQFRDDNFVKIER